MSTLTTTRGPHGPSALASTVYQAPDPPCLACEYFDDCRYNLLACEAFYAYVIGKQSCKEAPTEPISLYYFNQMERWKPERKMKPGDEPNKPLVRHVDDLPCRHWYDERVFKPDNDEGAT